jgi:hypothetical protein
VNHVRLVRRLLPALVLLALVPVVLAGCSGKGKKPPPRPTIPQREADDIAQILATNLASDQGGWYATVKVLCESLAVTPHSALTYGRPSMAHATSIAGAYSFTKAGVTWNANVAYFHLDNTAYATRDTAVDYLEAYLHGDGVFTEANGLTGTYGFRNSSTPADTNSWGLTVFGLGSNADTLEFSGFGDDTCYALVHSSLNTDGPRLWYMGGAPPTGANFIDFTIKVPKNALLSAPYPVDATSYISWVIEADSMNGADGASRTDVNHSILTEAEMRFTGVPPGFGLLTIEDIAGDAVYTYRYKVDLTTGAITRAN